MKDYIIDSREINDIIDKKVEIYCDSDWDAEACLDWLYDEVVYGSYGEEYYKTDTTDVNFIYTLLRRVGKGRFHSYISNITSMFIHSFCCYLDKDRRNLDTIKTENVKDYIKSKYEDFIKLNNTYLNDIKPSMSKNYNENDDIKTVLYDLIFEIYSDLLIHNAENKLWDYVGEVLRIRGLFNEYKTNILDYYESDLGKEEIERSMLFNTIISLDDFYNMLDRSIEDWFEDFDLKTDKEGNINLVPCFNEYYYNRWFSDEFYKENGNELER